jgi:hypothetical protein
VLAELAALPMEDVAGQRVAAFAIAERWVASARARQKYPGSPADRLGTLIHEYAQVA